MAIAIPITIAAYDSYDTLTAAVPDYLDAQIDITQVQGWVALVEKEINRRLALKPVRPQMTRLPLTLDAEYVTIPYDFMKSVSFAYIKDTERRYVRHVDYLGIDEDSGIPQEWLFETTVDYEGAPEVFAVIDGQARLYPVPDQTYYGNLLYYATLPPISEANQTNWFLQAHTDVYLYGLLFHANAFLPDREKAAEWFQLFDSRLNQVLSAYPDPPIQRKLRSDLVFMR